MASLPPDVVLIPSVLEFQCSFMILIHAAKYHHFARSNCKLQVAFSVFVTVPRNIPGDEAPGDRCRAGSAQDEASVRTQKTRMRLVRNAFRISLFWSFRKIVLCFSCGILYNKTGHPHRGHPASHTWSDSVCTAHYWLLISAPAA